jgi:hypothetical protein
MRFARAMMCRDRKNLPVCINRCRADGGIGRRRTKPFAGFRRGAAHGPCI